MARSRRAPGVRLTMPEAARRARELQEAQQARAAPAPPRFRPTSLEERLVQAEHLARVEPAAGGSVQGALRLLNEAERARERLYFERTGLDPADPANRTPPPRRHRAAVRPGDRRRLPRNPMQ